MAIINYSEYFDFDGYKKAIKDAESANKEFGTAVEGVAKRITASYADIKNELRSYDELLKMFNVNQRNAGKILVETGDAAVKLTTRAQEQKKVMQELAATTDLTTRSLKEIKTAAKEVEKEYSQLAGRSDDVRAKQDALAKEYGRLTGAAKVQAEVLKTTAKVINAAENSYNRLQIELTQVGNKLKNLPGAFDAVTGKINLNNKEAVELQKRYLAINNTLKTADATLGNHQRNVGNYASATHSLSQVLREFPSFAISAQTGILALSNNLPILFDQFSNVRKETGSTGKALQIFGQSLFSTGNILTIGITLLTVYGKEVSEFIGNLFRNADALSEVRRQQEALNKVQKEASESAGKEIASLQLLYKVATDATIPIRERKKAVDELQKQYPDHFKNINDEIILQGKAKDAYEATKTAILEAAKARAIESSLGDLATKELNNLKQRRDVTQELIKGDKILREQEKKANSEGFNPKGAAASVGPETQKLRLLQQQIQAKRQLLVENAKESDQIKRDSEFLLGFIKTAEGLTTTDNKSGKSADDLLAERIKRAQDLLKATADLEIEQLQLSLEQKLISEEEFQIKKLGIIKDYTDGAIALERQRGKKAEQDKIIDLKAEKVKAEGDYQKAINKIVDDNRKEDLDDAKKAIEDEAAIKVQGVKNEQVVVLASKLFTDQQKEALELDYQNRIDNILIDSIDRRITLETDAAKKIALEKQKAELQTGINKRSSAFNDTSVNKKYNDEIKAAKTAFDIIRAGRDTSFKEELEYLQRLKSIKLKYAKDTAEEELAIKILYADLEKQLKLKTEETIRMGIQAGLDITNSLISSGFENRIRQIEEEKQRAIDAAGNNAAARERIEKEYNKRISVEKTKAAKSDKAFALFNVAVNTAQGISKNLAMFGMPAAIPFNIQTAIQGAIQAAVILARPIPKYKTGRKGGKAEAAIVDEAGPELIVDKHGRLKEIGGGGDRLTWLNEGDKVHTADETKRIIGNLVKDADANAILKEMKLSGRLSSSIREGKQAEAIAIMTRAMQNGGVNTRNLERAFKNAVEEIPIHTTIIDEKGQRERVTRANDTITYLNKQSKLL
jgi:hypothetical protein